MDSVTCICAYVTIQNSGVSGVGEVSLVYTCFETSEMAAEGQILDQLERCVLVVRIRIPDRLIGPRGHPYLLCTKMLAIAAGRKSGLEVCVGIRPGRPRATARGIPVNINDAPLAANTGLLGGFSEVVSAGVEFRGVDYHGARQVV